MKWLKKWLGIWGTPQISSTRKHHTNKGEIVASLRVESQDGTSYPEFAGRPGAWRWYETGSYVAEKAPRRFHKVLKKAYEEVYG